MEEFVHGSGYDGSTQFWDTKPLMSKNMGEAKNGNEPILALRKPQERKNVNMTSQNPTGKLYFLRLDVGISG